MFARHELAMRMLARGSAGGVAPYDLLLAVVAPGPAVLAAFEEAAT